MAREYLCTFVVLLTQALLEADSKCVTTFLTTCEKVADVSRYAKPTWEILTIKSNECSSGRVQKNTEVLSAGVFNTTWTWNLEQLYIVEKVNSVESDTFRSLKNLQYLKMWGNSLKVLQRGMFANFESLRKLDLRYNSIENLAHGFCEGSSIKEVDLSFNSLTNIQVDMLDLPSLEVLKMTHNRISFISPKAFHSNLVTLDLRHNDLEEFQGDTFDSLSNLQQLLVSNNKLNTVSAFAALENLEVLKLSYNNIETIPSEAFSNLLELKQLSLDNNNLKTLHPAIFARKLNIEILHLHRNNLTSLSGLIGEALPKLKEITIAANPWYCQCLLGITEYIRGRKIQLTACERRYLSDGSSPICVSIKTDCEKYQRLNDDVFEEFNRGVQSYKCDRSDLQ